MFDKRYQVHRTFFTVKNFPKCVDAAMPNNNNIIRTKLKWQIRGRRAHFGKSDNHVSGFSESRFGSPDN